MVAISKIFGLPAHPLFVHVPIVLVPVAMITSILAIFKKFRREFLVATATMAVIGAVFLSLSIEAGESLKHDLPKSEAIHEHAEIGEQSQGPTIAFAAFAVSAVVAGEAIRRNFVYKNRSLPKQIAPVLLALTLVGGVVSTVVVTQAGHSGAKAVWDSRLSQTKP
ncbi:MAG: DUF2231 domain-containing protein [Actinomycetota bacterium]